MSNHSSATAATRRAARSALVATAIAIAALTAGCSGGAPEPRSTVAAGFAASQDDAAPRKTMTPTPTPTPTPVVVTTTVAETLEEAYSSSTAESGDLDVGTTSVGTAGAPGVRTRTWSVTTTDGVETARVLVSDVVTTAPVAELVLIGTRVPPPAPVAFAAPPEPAVEPDAGAGSGCDPNYAGACVPIDSDVDCAGGSGNGPSYTDGPVQIIGVDIYDLDRDGDGIACDA